MTGIAPVWTVAGLWLLATTAAAFLAPEVVPQMNLLVLLLGLAALAFLFPGITLLFGIWTIITTQSCSW